MSKIWGFKIENCDTSEVFKNKKIPRNSKRMYGSLHGIKAEWASMPVQHKILIQSLLNFQFLKSFPVPQFSLLNPQIFGTYELWHALSISDTYKVLMSGFQLPQAAWERSITPFALVWYFLHWRYSLTALLSANQNWLNFSCTCY